MADRDVEKARREAKLRKRAGQAKTHTQALTQLATENGYEDWPEYAKALAALPPPLQDFRIRLVGASGSERTMGVQLAKVRSFHELDAAQWEEATAQERLNLVFEYALSARRERGDMERYTPELIESNVLDLTVPASRGALAVSAAGPVASQADFLVVLESRSTGAKETVGVQLADLLEFHGLRQADWDGSSWEEKEALVEESALWAKRSTGDLAGYFTEVVSGLDEGNGEGDAPR